MLPRFSRFFRSDDKYDFEGQKNAFRELKTRKACGVAELHIEVLNSLEILKG